MIRRKSLHSQLHPDYSGSDFFYTLKLTHGGTVLHDSGMNEYIGGRISVFDFIDGRAWGIFYLNGLCAALGYQGSKTYFACIGGKLVLLDNDDQALKVKEEARDMELSVYLESDKNALNLLDGLENDELNVVPPEGVSTLIEDVVVKGVGIEMGDDNMNGTGDNYNSEEDEDFTYSSDSCDDIIDDIEFDINVDKDEEFAGIHYMMNDGESSDSSLYDNSDDGRSDSDFESLATDVDDEDESGADTSSSSHGRIFVLGKKYSTKSQFKDEVNDYAVKTGRACKFVKNDNRRIYAKCKKMDESCGWHIHVLKVIDEDSFQIRQMDLTHSCARQSQVDNAKSTWLAKRFETAFRCDPNRTVEGFRKSAIAELGVQISPQQAFRARQKALKKIEGESTDQHTVFAKGRVVSSSSKKKDNAVEMPSEPYSISSSLKEKSPEA